MNGAPCGARRPHRRLLTTPERSIRRMDFAHAEQEMRAAVRAAGVFQSDVIPAMRRAAAAYAQQVGAMLADMASALKDMEQTPDVVSVKHYSYVVPKTRETL